jgi:hypothetical protein
MFTNLILSERGNEVFRSVLPNFVRMIAIGDALVSEDVFDELFACDLSKCKGACCVKGESGAPLMEDELQRIEDVFDVIRPHLREEALEVIDQTGLFVVDSDGDLVTPIINGQECVYATFDKNGTAKCAFEQAYQRGESDWQKPMSCHLYPVRLKELHDFTAVNVHRWDICEGARSCGASSNVTVLEFCKTSLVRRFGGAWYDEAVAVWQVWKQSGRSKRSSQ